MGRPLTLFTGQWADMPLETLAQKAEFLYGAAVAHLLAGQPHEAIGELTRALELNPNQIKFYSLRAGLLRKQAEYDEALKDLKMALNIHHSVKNARRVKQQQTAAAAASKQPSTKFAKLPMPQSTPERTS